MRDHKAEFLEFDTLEKAKQHIVWCRTNLGDRGSKWDFNTTGGLGKKMVLYFFDEGTHAGWLLRWG